MLMLTALSLSCASCADAVRRRVAAESVDAVRPAGLSGVQVTLTVRNDLRRDIALDSCRLDFRLPSGARVQAELRGGAELPRRTTRQVNLRFKISTDIRSAMQLAGHVMNGGSTDGVTVDIRAVARIGGRERRIYAPQRNLSEILCNFGEPKDESADRF